MLRVGIVGWRGMVGSVLVQRMREEKDFDHVEPVFFSTSRAGGKGPDIGKGASTVADATDIAALKKLPVIISCQGGDAAQMRELVQQMGHLGDVAKPAIDDPAASALDIDLRVTAALRNGALPKAEIGYPLAASLLPWIDKDLGDGQSREEWKAQAEGNKILGP